jgi:hypothetical protein
MSTGESPLLLDEKVWHDWLEKGHSEEQLYFARRLKVSMFISPLLLVGLLFWFFAR